MFCSICEMEINGIYHKKIKGEREFLYGFWENHILEEITLCEDCNHE